jgi:hypothetical protein
MPPRPAAASGIKLSPWRARLLDARQYKRAPAQLPCEACVIAAGVSASLNGLIAASATSILHTVALTGKLLPVNYDRLASIYSLHTQS